MRRPYPQEVSDTVDVASESGGVVQNVVDATTSDDDYLVEVYAGSNTDGYDIGINTLSQTWIELGANSSEAEARRMRKQVCAERAARKIKNRELLDTIAPELSGATMEEVQRLYEERKSLQQTLDKARYGK